MKNAGIFILGLLCGFIAYPTIYSGDGGNHYQRPDIKMLSSKGDCITSNNLEVFQTLDSGAALAHPAGDSNIIVLLFDESDRLFYDGEKIKNPANHCAKQIGTFTYETKAEIEKTVPVVVIEEKDK